MKPFFFSWYQQYFPMNSASRFDGLLTLYSKIQRGISTMYDEKWLPVSNQFLKENMVQSSGLLQTLLLNVRCLLSMKFEFIYFAE